MLRRPVGQQLAGSGPLVQPHQSLVARRQLRYSAAPSELWRPSPGVRRRWEGTADKVAADYFAHYWRDTSADSFLGVVARNRHLGPCRPADTADTGCWSVGSDTHFGRSSLAHPRTAA